MKDKMKVRIFRYPRFKSDLYVIFQDLNSKFLLEKNLKEIKELGEVKVKYRLRDEPKENEVQKSEFLKKESLINIFLSNDLIKHYIETQSSTKKIISSIFPLKDQRHKLIIRSVKKILHSDYQFIHTLVYFKTSDKFVLQFILYLDDLLNESNLIEKLIKVIYNYENETDDYLMSQVHNTEHQRDRFKCFEFINDQWEIVNPLLKISQTVNRGFRKRGDNRKRKPTVFVNKNNFRDTIVFDNHWVLKSNDLSSLMIRPNDMSIYTNISKTHLEQGEKYFFEVLQLNLKMSLGNSPSDEQQMEYYDYFETMIISIIFSYTSIESFVNICIPVHYKHNFKQKGERKEWSKSEIEQFMSLRDKLKKVLRKVLKTPDPSKEEWWNDLIKLESLRKQLIHPKSKQKKSEKRYSELLNKEVFDVIRVNQSVIRFLGKYIFDNNSRLLDEYPYDFGYDDFIPKVMDTINFKTLYNSIYNPSQK